MYKIIFIDEKQFAQDISKIWSPDQWKILDKINTLGLQGLDNNQVKKLKHYSLSDFRLRVWNYRILFNFFLDKKEIHIIRILHRSKLY